MGITIHNTIETNYGDLYTDTYGSLGKCELCICKSQTDYVYKTIAYVYKNEASRTNGKKPIVKVPVESTVSANDLATTNPYAELYAVFKTTSGYDNNTDVM